MREPARVLSLRADDAPRTRNRAFRVFTEVALVTHDVTGCMARSWAAFWGIFATWVNSAAAATCPFVQDTQILRIQSAGEERWVRLVRAAPGVWRLVVLDAEYQTMSRALIAQGAANFYDPEMDAVVDRRDRALDERIAAVACDPNWLQRLTERHEEQR